MIKSLVSSEQKNAGPVNLTNKFNVKSEEAEQFLKTWTADA